MEGPVIARHPRAPSTNGAAQTSVMYLARTTGITNVPPSLSLSLSYEIRSFDLACGRRLPRSIDRSILRVHESNSYAGPTQAYYRCICTHTRAYNGAAIMCTIVNTRNEASLLGVLSLLRFRWNFWRRRGIRGDSRSVPPRRSRRRKGWQRWGRQAGKADVCSEIIHRP